VTSVAISPDSKYLASGSEDKTVKLWSVASQKEISTLQEHTYGINCIAFSTDGMYLATGS
jgi:WD40 repeat protein